jgi:hypothetical protein
MINEAKIIFNNIKNLRHLITEGVGENVIIDAINNHEWIYLYYNGDEKTPKGYRTIRPYVLGTSKAGNKVLRAWQDNPKNSYHYNSRPTRKDSQGHDYWTDEEGIKPGWRMFRVDRISKIYPIGKKFNDSNGIVMIPAGYHEGGDDDMTNIEAYVSTKTKPDFEYKYDKQVKGAGQPSVEAKWDSIRKGNKNRKKITSNDIIKLRDLASKFYKKSLSNYVIVIDDRNNFQLITVNDVKNKNIPETAIVGSLPYLYDSIVKANTPANDKFFDDIKNKTKASLEQQKQKEMNRGFSTIQEVEENLPKIPYERKTFFKQ